jgi:ADP-ribosylglycohydrolase
MGHDPIDPVDLLRHTDDALRETQIVVPPAGPGDTIRQLLSVREALMAYETADEPSHPEAILMSLEAREDDDSPELDSGELDRKLLGGWLGRCAGNGLGKPFETVDWTPAAIRDYLHQADAWPLTDYVPLLDPMPTGFVLREDCAATTTRGNVAFVTRDDDLDYTLLNLILLERFGVRFTARDVAAVWLDLLPFGKMFTAEAVAYRNVTLGLDAPETAIQHNPYREWVGALIRADAFGFVSPGRPRSAAALALTDATLSHTRNGIYGEMWAAAAVALAFVAESLEEIVERSLLVVPPRSRLRGALEHVLHLWRVGAEWEEALAWIHSLDYYYVHVVSNAAIIAAALLWSGGDFTRAVGLSVSSALDTDSHAATVGAVVGVFVGADGIPSHWTEPLNDRFRSALSGHAEESIIDLARRTRRVIDTAVLSPSARR